MKDKEEEKEEEGEKVGNEGEAKERKGKGRNQKRRGGEGGRDGCRETGRRRGKELGREASCICFSLPRSNGKAGREAVRPFRAKWGFRNVLKASKNKGIEKNEIKIM